MSLDLYQRETAEKLGSLGGVTEPEAGAFDGFLRGTAMGVMRKFAEGGRALSMAAAAPLARLEGIVNATGTGIADTTLSDAYFKWHDDVLGRAVDAWTPRPNEVGVAGQVVGELAGMLPFIIASPAAAAGIAGMSSAEDLVRKGVEPMKATAVGAVQTAGLGLGIWMPVLGQNLWQRLVVGGAGFNLAQGTATRAASGAILEGTPAAEEFKAFDGKAMTLDVLLGAAFGSLAHLSRAQREQGAAAWTRIRDWASELPPADVDAIAVLRQAQHANVDSMGGTPKDVGAIEAHRERLRAAGEQLARDERVEVSTLEKPAIEPDPARWTEAEARATQIRTEADALAKAYDLVLEKPIGPVNDPLVRLTPEAIGEVIVERGPAWKKGEAEMRIGGFGLVKFIWKHGEKADRAAPENRVTKADIVRTPEVMRDYAPIRDETQPDGKRIIEWQVEREDGKKVLYAVSRFTETDNAQHLVSVFVNDGSNKKIAGKPLSEKTNRPAESPDRASTARGGDTGQGTYALDAPGGQKGGSGAIVETEGPAGQPSGAEPPPPRGAEAGKPAGPEAERADPLALQADQFVAERPDLPIVVGHDADGEPIVKSAREYLAGVRTEASRSREAAKLFEVAAACMLGVN